VDFPDLNNLQPLMPEAFPEGELMGWLNEGGNELEQVDQLEQN
jgi:hypothetical protein